MIIDCQSCGATYNIAEDKVRGRRVRVRCKNCGSAIIVDGLSLDADDATRQVPASYVKEHEEDATRVMSAPMRPVWREPAALPRPPSAPPPAAIEWTVNFEGSEQRPMSLDDIIEAYQSGLVTRDAYAWREGLPGWVPIFDIPEIRSALESSEPTRVVGASELRRARAASAERTPAAPMPPLPPLRGAPLPYVPPAPALATRDLPSDVEYSPPAPLPRSARPKPPPAARVTTARSGPDLFDRAELAGSERELLASQSEPPPSDSLLTGARRESSILFSLDALKGARRPGASGLPSRPSASGPRTAPDILGFSAGSAMGLMSADPALLTAPAAEPPPPSSYPARSQRARMDTTPPAARRSGKFLYVLGGALAAALVMAGSVTVFEKVRANPAVNAAPTATPAAKAPAPLPAPPAIVVATSAVSAVPAPPATAAAPASPAAVSPQTAPATAAQKPPSAPAPAANTLVAPRSPAAPAAATPKATASAAPAAPNVAVPKVVLEEESGGAAAPTAAAVPPAQPAGPAFDTAAAKAALTSAAATASGCKEPGGPTGSGKVQVTFATSGRATSANIVSGPFAGTSVGGCVARAFRQAQVPAFSGNSVTVSKGFTISE